MSSPFAKSRSSDRLGEYGRRNRQAMRMVLWLLIAFVAVCLSIEFGHWQKAPDEFGHWQKAPDGASQVLATAVSWMFGNGDLPDGAVWHQVLVKIAAPFLLPLLGVLAFVDSLRQRGVLTLRRVWPDRFTRPLVVVIGLGQKGLEIVHTELSGRNHCVVIEQDPDSPLISEAKSLGATVWIGDGESAIDIDTACWKRPTRIWITTRSTERNLRILDRVNRSMGGVRSSPNLARLDVHVRVNSVADLLDGVGLSLLNQDKSNYLTHLITLEESAAQWLMRCHPVRIDDSGRAPRVLLIGAGAFGRAIFRELLLLCHFPETDLEVLTRASTVSDVELSSGRVPEVVVVDRNDEAISSLLAEFPFLESRHIKDVTPCIAHRIHSGQEARMWSFEDYRDLIRAGRSFSHIFVAMGSEVANLAAAERIWAWERQLNPRFQTTIVPVVYDKQAIEWNRISEGAREVSKSSSADRPSSAVLPHVQPFCLQESRSADAFKWQQGLERMAECIHRKYPGGTSWHELSEEKRRSNLAQARAVWNRFRRGSRWETESLSADEREFECEHRRWNAYVLASGFTEGRDGANWDDTFGIDLGGNTTAKLRDLARANPSLNAYKRLTQDKRDNDINFVKARHSIMRAFESRAN